MTVALSFLHVVYTAPLVATAHSQIKLIQVSLYNETYRIFSVNSFMTRCVMNSCSSSTDQIILDSWLRLVISLNLTGPDLRVVCSWLTIDWYVLAHLDTYILGMGLYFRPIYLLSLSEIRAVPLPVFFFFFFKSNRLSDANIYILNKHSVIQLQT